MPKTKEQPTEETVILSVRNRRKSGVQIVWRQGADVIDRDFHDAPLPAFYKSLEALSPHVCSLCEFPSKDAEKIVPTGITLREHGDNTLGLVVARKAIKKGDRVFNISTPLLPMYVDEENKSADHMTEAEAAAIEKVVKEAKRYIAGERAQGLINFPEGEPDDEKRKKKEADEGTAAIPGIGDDGPPAGGSA
jgi:hypothetical protein